MITAIIWGTEIYASYLKKIVTQFYNKVVGDYGGEPIVPVAFLDAWGNESTGDPQPDLPIIGFKEAREWVLDGRIEVLLIPREDYRNQGNYLTGFLSLDIGLENIYIAHRLNEELSSIETIADMFTPYYSERHLPYLEFHIADHCNLKCADCEHYSGLVEKPVFPEFDSLESDFKQLRKFIDEIDVIRILGGEPLLNREIGRYIELAHNVYPDAVVVVVTNGLLLRSMPDEFFETVKRCTCRIDISLYPVMEDQIQALREFLEKKDVPYLIGEMNRMFRKQQLLEPQDDEQTAEKYRVCFQKGCVNLYDGHLAACFLPFTTKYFNSYFDKALPEDGAVDLYQEGLTIEEIKHRLSEPFERCRYCGMPEDTPWHIIHNPSVLGDWVKEP